MKSMELTLEGVWLEKGRRGAQGVFEGGLIARSLSSSNKTQESGRIKSQPQAENQKKIEIYFERTGRAGNSSRNQFRRKKNLSPRRTSRGVD